MKLPPITDWHDVDAGRFRDQIIPLDRPTVLRGLVRDWPAVRRGRQSPQALCADLVTADGGAPVDAILSDVLVDYWWRTPEAATAIAAMKQALAAGAGPRIDVYVNVNHNNRRAARSPDARSRIQAQPARRRLQGQCGRDAGAGR